METSPFSPNEAVAVAVLIWTLICSDQQLSANESHYFQQTLQYLGVTPEAFDIQLSKPEEEAYAVVLGMSARKRSHCATLLRLAYQSDELVDRVELRKLNEILIRAELFRTDEKKRIIDDELIL
jgi:hypothetical protein